MRFCACPGRDPKIVIGDGPELPRLKQQYPNATYAGYKFGEELARHVAAADVFVFPSLTDTFGLVNLEAMACGVPVAAFPVTGPIDVVEDGVTGALDQDLARAALRALTLKPQACRRARACDPAGMPARGSSKATSLPASRTDRRRQTVARYCPARRPDVACERRVLLRSRCTV